VRSSSERAVRTREGVVNDAVVGWDLSIVI
jgi:hypothetical protein